MKMFLTHDEDLLMRGVLDSKGTVGLDRGNRNRFDIRVPVTEFVVMTGIQLIKS